MEKPGIKADNGEEFSQSALLQQHRIDRKEIQVGRCLYFSAHFGIADHVYHHSRGCQRLAESAGVVLVNSSRKQSYFQRGNPIVHASRFL